VTDDVEDDVPDWLRESAERIADPPAPGAHPDDDEEVVAADAEVWTRDEPHPEPLVEPAAAPPTPAVAAPAGGGEPRDEARRALEAVLVAATEPVEARFLAELVELPVETVEALCDTLAEEYERDERGFVLRRVAGGYRLQTHPDLAGYVEHFVLDGQHVRLSGPALETLAIVAYKQPISRAQVSAIRGVNVETTLQTLMQRGYIAEVARDPGPGLAVLYGTTATFLERLGLNGLDDLPPLGDFVPDAGIVAALERGLRLSDDPTPEPAEPADG